MKKAAYEFVSGLPFYLMILF